MIGVTLILRGCNLQRFYCTVLHYFVGHRIPDSVVASQSVRNAPITAAEAILGVFTAGMIHARGAHGRRPKSGLCAV